MLSWRCKATHGFRVVANKHNKVKNAHKNYIISTYYIIVHTHNRFSLFLFFPLSGCLRCCPPPNFSTASPYSFSSLRLFSSSSSLPPLLPSSHLSLQASHLSIGLHRVILPSSRNSVALLVSLAIFRTQLFPYTCSFCCCSSFIAKVPFLYRHAGVTQSAHDL